MTETEIKIHSPATGEALGSVSVSTVDVHSIHTEVGTTSRRQVPRAPQREQGRRRTFVSLDDFRLSESCRHLALLADIIPATESGGALLVMEWADSGTVHDWLLQDGKQPGLPIGL